MAVYPAGYSDSICYSFTSHFLYPPLNLVSDTAGCTAILTWEKPVDLSTGLPPVGLTGYNIYRDSVLIHYNPDPDSLFYYDNGLDPGTYSYLVSAYYDLSSYGFPGQYNESYPAGPASVAIICGLPIPFHEDWEEGTFSYYHWEFDPSQGNWTISSAKSAASHAADFSFQPFVTNYSNMLISENLDASRWNCSNLWLDFDLKLIDRYNTSTEHLEVDLFYDQAWHVKADFPDAGSFDWSLKHLDISEAKGKGLKIGFRAYGENSTNFLHWYVDNINIYGICRPPLDLTSFQDPGGSEVHLSWSAPDCEDLKKLKASGVLARYNIYRTGLTGQPPYDLLDTVPATTTLYTDVLPPLPGGAGIYDYYVTALFTDPLSNSVICESTGSDTTQAGYPAVPAGSLQPLHLRVYPNPADDLFRIESNYAFDKVELTTLTGQRILGREAAGQKLMVISTNGIPAGIYLVTVITGNGTGRVKIVIVK
ncbi:MAG TPA: T9SS type A sorting domain-containing protein [Bacteroidales bacterium]|nr:T9SS type A sorting domain-containing protein [Bacteroidales bacterium]